MPVAQPTVQRVALADLHTSLPTLQATLVTTAILDAGRRSLDSGGATVALTHS